MLYATDVTAQTAIHTMLLTTTNESDPVGKDASPECCPSTPAVDSDYPLHGSYEYATVLPTASSTIYSYEVRVLLATLYTLIALGAIVGNILVIGSVYTNRKLRTITNLFVVSLAFSDLMVGLLVLPFAIKVQVTGTWGLGGALCASFVTFDVLLCTASILNLCCISIDRYFAITRPLASATQRSKRLALLMIAVVWVLSVIITIPPLLGWKRSDRPDGQEPDPPLRDGKGTNDCDLFQEKGYVIYSACGSFYIPLAIMLFVYANIFIVARNAQRRWRNHSSRRSSTRSSKRGSTPPSPVASLSPNISGGNEERRSAAVGLRPKAMRVLSTASDTICCGCLGGGQWSGTYSLTVDDDWSLSPGVVAESYNRQTTGFEGIKRAIVIYGARPNSVERDARSCALNHDRERCLTERESGLCPTRLYSQLSDSGCSAKLAAGPERRKSSSESETRLSVVGPEDRPSSTGSTTRTRSRILNPAHLTECTRRDTPSEPRAKQDPAAHDQTRPSSNTFFSWKRRRHSSLDGLFCKRTRPTIAESTAKSHSSANEGQVLCNRALVIRHSDPLPTRLSIQTTVSITTTPSTGSRTSSRSDASAEGNNSVSPKTRNLSEMNSENIDRALNSRRCALLRVDKQANHQHSYKDSCVTTSELTAPGSTENSEPIRNHSDVARTPRGLDACLFDSPRRRAATGEFNASFRSMRRPPRQQNPTTDDSRSYGSFADATMTPTMARQMSRLSQKTPTMTRERREHSAVFRESKTVKTVSIVIGCFVLCWLPFFVVYISEPFLSPPFSTNDYLKNFVTWLGYFNSVINPFIYAFYNYEFRSTFWHLTIGRVWKRSRRLPRGVAPSSPLNNVLLRHQPSLRNKSVIVLNRPLTNR